MLRQGFDIHHIDGDHSNDTPGNLVFIEHTDHMFLHSGGVTLGRMKPRIKLSKEEKRLQRIKEQARTIRKLNLLEPPNAIEGYTNNVVTLKPETNKLKRHDRKMILQQEIEKRLLEHEKRIERLRLRQQPKRAKL
jgi:hypothetical protein